MKKNYTWLMIIVLLIGILIIAFAAWKFIQSNALLSPRVTPTYDPEVTVFQPLTTQGGRVPFFIDDPKELYYQDNQNNLVKVTLDENGPVLSELQSLPSLPTFNWAAGNAWGLMEWQDSPEVGATLGKLHQKTYEIVTLREDAWGGSWTPDNKITFLQSSDEGVGLWQMESDGSKATKLAALNDLSAPAYTAWSKVGNRLLVQSAFGAAIFSPADDTVIQVGFIEYAEGSVWSPDGWTLAFRTLGEEQDALWVANLDGADQKKIFEGVFSAFNWLPDGRLVFFTAGKEGGAACWALVPRTGTKVLLADSSAVFYKPLGQIAVSPTGDALAFQAQDQQIWLLKLVR